MKNLLIIIVVTLSSFHLAAQNNCQCRIDSVVVMTDTAKCTEYNGQFTEDTTSFVARVMYLDTIGEYLEWAVTEESPYLEYYRLDFYRDSNLVISKWYDPSEVDKSGAVWFYATEDIRRFNRYWKVELYGTTVNGMELRLAVQILNSFTEREH